MSNQEEKKFIESLGIYFGPKLKTIDDKIQELETARMVLIEEMSQKEKKWAIEHRLKCCLCQNTATHILNTFWYCDSNHKK